jgi:DNA-binding CsgD family transcriptional regulator
MPRLDILDRKEEILNWIEEHQSKAFIAKELKCKPSTLNSYLEKMGIVYEGNKGSKGKPHSH